MIVSAFILFISLVFTSLSIVLPAGDTLPSGVVSAYSWLVGETYKFDYIFPIGTAWLAISIMIPVLLAYFLWNGVQWVMSFIRGN